MDAYLIEGIQENNEAVFSTVYQAYHAKLYFYFFKKTQSVNTSRELVQTTFIKCWNNRHHLNRDMGLSPQLFRIAKTTFIDLVREKARERLVLLEEGYDTIKLSNEEEVAHPLLEEVTASLDRIPAQRSKIIKFRLQGLTNQEIADRLGISKKTVENQLNKAVKEIRSQVRSTADLSFPLFLLCLVYFEEMSHSVNGLC